jgi:type IV pilus assembly protein PilN
VRNLEHSHRFLEPRIVGENAEASGGPNQRMEPVSASNRFTFDLLAEYNPLSAEERRPAASAEKPPADGRLAHPRATASLAGRPPYTGLAQGRSKPNPAIYSHPTPGGQQ